MGAEDRFLLPHFPGRRGLGWGWRQGEFSQSLKTRTIDRSGVDLRRGRTNFTAVTKPAARFMGIPGFPDPPLPLQTTDLHHYIFSLVGTIKAAVTIGGRRK